MTEQQKTTTPQGGAWTKLESTGDVKRFLRWTILQLKAGKLDRQNAAVLGQLGCYLLKAIEGNDLAERVAALEKMIEGKKRSTP
jgi:hypothetical protein